MFIDSKVQKLQDRYSEFFENPRKYWGEDGRIAAEVDLARRQTRQASAEDGFYTMVCRVELGGGRLGDRLYLEVWEALCHRYGSPQTTLAFQVLAHTSTGPSAL